MSLAVLVAVSVSVGDLVARVRFFTPRRQGVDHGADTADGNGYAAFGVVMAPWLKSKPLGEPDNASSSLLGEAELAVLAFQQIRFELGDHQGVKRLLKIHAGYT